MNPILHLIQLKSGDIDLWDKGHTVSDAAAARSWVWKRFERERECFPLCQDGAGTGMQGALGTMRDLPHQSRVYMSRSSGY